MMMMSADRNTSPTSSTGQSFCCLGDGDGDDGCRLQHIIDFIYRRLLCCHGDIDDDDDT